MGVNWLGLGMKLLDTLVDAVSPHFRSFILHFLLSLLSSSRPYYHLEILCVQDVATYHQFLV
jgi:hypothetical protein